MSSLHVEPSSIVIKDGIITNGTLDDLIIFLTSDNYQYKEDAWPILLFGKHMYASAEDFLDKLIERFKVPKESNKTPGEIQSIQLSVINLLISWIHCYYLEDFSSSPSLLLKLNNYMQEDIRVPAYNDAITKALNSSQQKKETRRMKTKEVITSSIPFIDIPEIEIAKQLTWGDFEIYSALRPHELLFYEVSTTREALSPHVIALVQRSNRVCGWVVDEVLAVEDVRDRARVLGKFVEIAWCCKELRNYHSTQSILSALDTTSIYRLRKTFELLTKDQIAKFDELRELCSHKASFKNLRAHIHYHGITVPHVLFLGVILTDMSFTLEGNALSFHKLRLIHKIVKDMQQSVAIPYHLTRDPYIQGLINTKTLTNIDEQYKLSLQREPREKRK